MSEQDIKARPGIGGVLITIAVILVLQGILVLVMRNDLLAFGLLLLLAAVLLTLQLFIKGRR